MIARYTRPELARLWSDDHRYDIWLRIELAACEEMETAGSVPRGTAAAVRAKAEGKLSAARILEHEERTRHDVIAFLTHVEELAGEPARWLHLGMTSSDVLDAALAVQLCEATDQILEGLDKLRAACRRRADEERATPAIGRSHGIHAEPITAGLVFAGFYAELGRARRTLVAARREIAVGKIAGAVGTYANLDPAIEARAGEAGAAARGGADPDRRARSPCGLLRGAGARGHGDRASGADRAPLAAHRGRRGDRGLRQGAKGLVGDAAQEEPDLVGEPVRVGAPAAQLRGGGLRERGALARARHLALVGRAGDRPRRDRTRRLHGPARRRPHRRAGGQPRADAAQPRSHRRAVLQRGGAPPAGAQGHGAPGRVRARAAQRSARRGAAGRAGRVGEELPHAAGRGSRHRRQADAGRDRPRPSTWNHHLRYAGAIIDRALRDEEETSP